MVDIIENVYRTIREYNMIEEGDTVLVALSGGADSVFLLKALLLLKKRLKIDVCALHIHHHIRGEDADKDASFCSEISKNWGVPFKRFDVDVFKIAKDMGFSVEEAGRWARLKIYKEALKLFNAHKVATGHHTDDLAESVLLNLIHGAGIEGLVGIYPVYNSFLIRPLLFTTKEEIVDFLKKENIPFCEDVTNWDTKYTRNKIRHLLIPYIEKNFNVKIRQNLLKTSQILLEAYNFLESEFQRYKKKNIQCIGEVCKLGIFPLRKKHPFIAKYILRRAVKEVQKGFEEVNYLKTQQLYNLAMKKDTGGVVEIPHNIKVHRIYNALYISRGELKEPPPPPVSISFPAKRYIKEWNIHVRGEIIDVNKMGRPSPFVAYFDADCIGEGEFIIRGRKAGDRFSPYGMKGTKKIKDFFIDKKIPPFERDKVPLLEKDGEIIWVIGYRTSNKCPVTKTTKRVLKIEIEKP